MSISLVASKEFTMVVDERGQPNWLNSKLFVQTSSRLKVNI